ncbi:hypothetical protein [Arthrobacter sp.]|uniref:hypothetical protein n=1 Tax=Arthrobacter sp. TaxID=1667 RepID=UPI0028120667|nr:hypothetical protein [Arthrobacter sp.]
MILVVLAGFFLLSTVALWGLNVFWSVAMALSAVEMLVAAHYQRRSSPPIPRRAQFAMFTLLGAVLGLLWFSFQT